MVSWPLSPLAAISSYINACKCTISHIYGTPNRFKDRCTGGVFFIKESQASTSWLMRRRSHFWDLLSSEISLVFDTMEGRNGSWRRSWIVCKQRWKGFPTLYQLSWPLSWLSSSFQAYLHSMSIIHRDLNSHNCLVKLVGAVTSHRMLYSRIQSHVFKSVSFMNPRPIEGVKSSP